MAQSTSYPSPDVAHEGIHPFFSQQMPAPDNAHISHRPAANMQGGVNDRQDYGQLNHNGQGYGNVSQHEQLNHSGQVYGQASQNDSLRHLSTPQQLAQRGLDADQSEDHHDSESSARKRSKVSRACDDCRRKKVRFHIVVVIRSQAGNMVSKVSRAVH